MKRIFLISAALLIASSTFAQSDANSSDNTLYKFDNVGTAKPVRHLGSAPEFPFLRNLNSSHQVYAAIKKHENDNTRSMRKLNDLLMQVGYANGAKDLQASDITMTHLQPGTEGNMGSRGYTYSYYRLEGNASEFKAWRIAPANGSNSGPLYLFAKCGNAFYPKSNATACVSVPVTVTPDMNQITLNNTGNKMVTKNQVYVYYERKHRRKFEDKYNMPGLSNRYASKPVEVSATKDVDIAPETYTVTVSSPQTTVSACQDATLNVPANINVERTSAYTGNYPGSSDNKTYRKVTKHEYKVIARKMRRIHRKEAKIARKTGVPVEVKTQQQEA